MKRIMNFLMLSCKKSSGLIEKKLHFQLNPIEKIQLLVHTSMCDACKSYQNQSKEFDTLLDKHIHHNPELTDDHDDPLPDDIKKRILQELGENK